MNHLLCLGLGYSAATLCRRLPQASWRITGTSRTQSGADRIQASAWHGIPFDGLAASPTLVDALASATHLLVSAGPDEQGDPFLRHHAGDLANARQLRSIVYFSTVGVYGDHQGEWVDETTVCRPKSARSLARVRAEQDWLQAAAVHNKPVAVLRLAGIYGPGRNAFENLLAGDARRIIKPGQVFNRIHVEDIATATLAAFTLGQDQKIINVTDDEPAPPQDVVTHAAHLLGLPPPPEIGFAEADLSPMARSFYGENKRVANRLLRSTLAVDLAYPTYREGLVALLPDQLPRGRSAKA
jgi:nucleoside-diphosphate-sugar epimerase